MRIERNNLEKFIITKGKGFKQQYFTFFVDGTSSSWTSRPFFAVQYDKKETAEETLQELKRRARERKAGRP